MPKPRDEAKGYCVRIIDVHKYTAAELIEKLKVAQPRFFGGVHPEAMPAETLCNSAVDVVVRGDGEETFISILEGKPFETIRGISYRRGNTVVHTPSIEVEMNLDKYPLPAYHLVPMHKYYPAIGA